MKRRRMTYWCSAQGNDHQCYNFRAKTKKEVLEFLKTAYDPSEWTKPFKVIFEYTNQFDLVCQLLGEGGSMAEMYSVPDDDKDENEKDEK